MAKHMSKWKADDAYSGCKTARNANDFAVVIVPPELCDGSWGYQAYDEEDYAKIDSGEFCEECYGFNSEADVMRFCERKFCL